MKVPIRSLVVFYSLTLNFVFSQGLMRDSIYFGGSGFETYDWINIQDTACITDPKIREFQKKYRGYNEYRSIWKIRNDSLFFIGARNTNKPNLPYYYIRGKSNNSFFSCIDDTILVNTGKIIRNCNNCKDITEKETLLFIRDGKVIFQETYLNIIADKQLFNRENEREISNSCKNFLLNKIEWSSLEVNSIEKRNKKKASKLLIYTININKEGKIDSIKPKHGIDTVLGKVVFDLLWKIPEWQKRQKYGDAIAEKFNLEVFINPEEKTISCRTFFFLK